MPSLPNSSFKLMPLNDEEYDVLPMWAEKEYTQAHNRLYQVIEHSVKLESNIADLENMLEKGECPRSIQINVKINVAQEQQSEMDTALHEHTKLFQQSILKALIKARAKELHNKKQDMLKHCQQFQQFLVSTITDLRNNDIPLLLGTSDVDNTIQKCIDLFKKRSKRTYNLYKSLFFFQKKKADSQKQKRKELEAEKKINQELADPQLTAMKQQIDSLERTVRKIASKPPKPVKTRVTRKKSNESYHQAQKSRKNTKSAPKTNFLRHPKASGPSRQAVSKKGPPRYTKTVKQQLVRDPGNPKRPHRSINTTIPSESRPTSFRRKQN